MLQSTRMTVLDKTFHIGGVLIDPPLALAPMAEVTDVYYRSLVKELGGVGLVVSEFISAEGLTRDNTRTKAMLAFDEKERPVAIQIYGGRSSKAWAPTSSTSTWAAPCAKWSAAAQVRHC